MKSLFSHIVVLTSRFLLVKLHYGVHNLTISIKKLSPITLFLVLNLLMYSNLSMNTHAADLTKNSWSAAFFQQTMTQKGNPMHVYSNENEFISNLHFNHDKCLKMIGWITKPAFDSHLVSVKNFAYHDFLKPGVYAGRLILRTKEKSSFPGSVTIVHKQ